MKLNITARHLELTPALSDYVHKKMERVQRHFQEIVWAQVILSVEKIRQIAEFIVHAPGNTFRTKAESGDMYSAIDLALDKLNLHLTRVKDKKTRHRDKTNTRKRFAISENINLLLSSASEPAPAEHLLGSASELIREVKRIVLRPLSVHQAIQTLNASRMTFLPFINEQSNRINIIYRNGKQGYGILETEG